MKKQADLHFGDIQSLVMELQKENLKKKDFIIPSRFISMRDGELIVSDQANSQLKSILQETGIASAEDLTTLMRLTCLETCHQHLSEKLQIPKKYYDRMVSGNNEILDHSVSYWMHKHDKNVLLRTFIDKEEKSGMARAILSDRFKMIDNFDLLLACLEAIKEMGYGPDFLTIESADITDKRMYIRFVCPSIEVQAPELLKGYKVPGAPNGNIQVGDGIISGFVIKNSEIGFGQYTISPRATVLRCSNGMIFTDDNFAKTHLGRQMEEMSVVTWSEETKKLNHNLVIAQIKDAIRTFISPEYLSGKVAKLIEMNQRALEHPADCIKNVCQAMQVTEDKQKTILDYFMKSGDITPFGVTQALTLFAHKNGNADERFQLESAGVKVLANIEKFDKEFVEGKTAQTELVLVED